QELRDSEVEELREPNPVVDGQKDVRRFQIAVHDPRSVSGVERTRDAFEYRQRLAGGDRTGPGEVLIEGLSVEELHHVVVTTVAEYPERKDVDDVPVANVVHRACFVDESHHHLRVRGELPLEKLHRRGLPDYRMERLVDDPEAPLAEEPLDPVLPDHLA